MIAHDTEDIRTVLSPAFCEKNIFLTIFKAVVGYIPE